MTKYSDEKNFNNLNITICNVAQTFIYNTYCNIDIRRS